MPQHFDCMHYESKEQARVNAGSSGLQTTQADNDGQRKGSDENPAKSMMLNFMIWNAPEANITIFRRYCEKSQASITCTSGNQDDRP